MEATSNVRSGVCAKKLKAEMLINRSGIHDMQRLAGEVAVYRSPTAYRLSRLRPSEAAPAPLGGNAVLHSQSPDRRQTVTWTRDRRLFSKRTVNATRLPAGNGRASAGRGSGGGSVRICIVSSRMRTGDSLQFWWVEGLDMANRGGGRCDSRY
jgi:hypothetical protein